MAQPSGRIIAGTAILLAALTVTPVCAQPSIICSVASPVAPTIRHEGFTELTGDVILTCTGTPNSTPTPTVFLFSRPWYR